MKKAIILLSALLALVACNKENPQNEGVIDASKVVFNINIQKADDDATKGIKRDWVSGDVVYVFFDYNTTQCVKMTFNGSSWDYSNKDGGHDYSALTLVSGQSLSAVYIPNFVIGEANLFYDGETSKWNFDTELGGYILTAGPVVYTVTVGDVITLDATLSMEAPENMVQIYMRYPRLPNPGAGNEYVLNMTNVKPFTFGGIAPGGAATINIGEKATFPLPGYRGIMGGQDGHYFWGILANASAGEIDYNFQVVERNAEKKYAIGSTGFFFEEKELTGSTAIEVNVGGTEIEPFVRLGYKDCPLWATGNLNDDGTIAGPLEAGDYYKWCYTTPYDVTGETDPYDNYYNGDYTESHDPAFVKTGEFLCTPTADQFENLCLNSKVNQISWKDGVWKYAYLVTSDSNGITLCFPAVGIMYLGVHSVDSQAYVWTSSPEPGEPSLANYLFFQSGTPKYYIEPWDRFLGFPIRPIQL